MNARARAQGGQTPTHYEKWFFLACAVVGGVVIATVDIAAWSKWVAVTACVLIMIGYGVCAFHVSGLKVRADQAADNLYYLGLLYTLTSLGVALIRFTGTELATEAILSNFGIAIFTTIAGLAGRVLVGQFREDPEDAEEEARLALSQTVRRMRQELDLSVAELKSFADAMRQVVGEFTQRANTSTVEALEQAVGQFERSAGAMGEKFEASAEQFSTRVNSFDSSLERVVSAVEGLMDRIGAVKADADVIERGLRPALETVERTVAAFAASVGQEQAKFESAAGALERFSEAATGLTEAGSAAASTAQDLRTAGAALSDVARLVEQLNDASSAAAATTADFSQRLTEIAAQTDERNAQSVAELHRVAGEAAAAAGAEAEQRLAALDAAARRVIETLGTLDREFEGSGQAVQQVRRELAELAGWIITRLET